MQVVLAVFLFIICCITNGLKSSDKKIDLEFIIPASDEILHTSLSTQSVQDVTFYKIIRSILFINDIVMDCTFTFDTNSIHRNKPLKCDINNACISDLNLEKTKSSPSSSSNSIKLHFENLGVGDLTIIEIKQINQKTNYQKSLFYDGLLCIGDSQNCDGHRYIDFISDPNTKNLKVSPINSQIHNKLHCNSKDTKYQQIILNQDDKNESQDDDEDDDNYYYKEEPVRPQILGSRRRLMAVNGNNDNNDLYVSDRSSFENNVKNIIHHNDYMDIILTIVLLAMIVISVFNMSYAFNQFKSGNNNNNNIIRSYDTRRV